MSATDKTANAANATNAAATAATKECSMCQCSKCRNFRRNTLQEIRDIKESMCDIGFFSLNRAELERRGDQLKRLEAKLEQAKTCTHSTPKWHENKDASLLVYVGVVSLSVSDEEDKEEVYEEAYKVLSEFVHRHSKYGYKRTWDYEQQRISQLLSDLEWCGLGTYREDIEDFIEYLDRKPRVLKRAKDVLEELLEYLEDE